MIYLLILVGWCLASLVTGLAWAAVATYYKRGNQ